ncbi:MAG: phosphoglucosamine mutase [Oscillospiraceae bacterium]|jgi:phosphoglucosamine mutase|nr:phosphoglucosamine mutase [Oscillospiraceae bacterium]
MPRVFGTDGARGIANKEITCELALGIGRAMVRVLTGKAEAGSKARRPKVLIGTDTRASSPMLAAALAAGLNAAGADAYLLGVAPTPAVSFLTSGGDYAAGAMISASHNPAEYNGIKLFQKNGQKLPDALEEQIEAILLDETEPFPHPTGGGVGRTICLCETPMENYIDFLAMTAGASLAQDLADSGVRRIAVDCANGSAAATAGRLFAKIGFDSKSCRILYDNPDGININAKCGSTDLVALSAYVVKHKCALGLAFDGDADRLLAVDSTGAVVDGDKIIALCAAQMKKENRLHQDTVVATVMSNMGFHKYCERHGIAVTTTTVGDRYVLEEMLRGGYSLGGENSGHIIFPEYATAGDGQLSALQLLTVLAKTGRSLHDLAAEIEMYPQVLINVRVSNLGKKRTHTDPEILSAVAQVQQTLAGEGRVLLRVSGTEPVVRVMVEAKDPETTRSLAENLAAVVRERLI